MSDPYYPGEHGPVTWVGQHPIYAAHYVALVFALSLAMTAVLAGLGAAAAIGALTFYSPLVVHGQLWRVLTYGLVNSPRDLWFLLELLMIVWFGREVEKFFGRRKFFALYACLYLVPPIVYLLAGLRYPTTLAGESAGFGLFIAFAALYPNVQIFFGLLAKWVAWVLLAFYALQALADHAWLELTSLFAASFVAYAFVQTQAGRLQLPSLSLPRPGGGRGGRSPVSQPVSARPSPQENLGREVDAVLDKIARSGIESLSAKERAKLEAARERLRRKG